MADTRAETHLHIYDAFTLPHVRARSRVFGYRTRATAAIMSPSTSESVAATGAELKSAAIKIASRATYPRARCFQGRREKENDRPEGKNEGKRERERQRDTGGGEGGGGRALRLRNGRRSSALGLRNGKKLCNAPAKSLRSQL